VIEFGWQRDQIYSAKRAHRVLEASSLKRNSSESADDGPGFRRKSKNESSTHSTGCGNRARVSRAPARLAITDSLVKLQGERLAWKVRQERGVASTSACRSGLQFQSQQIMGGGKRKTSERAKILIIEMTAPPFT